MARLLTSEAVSGGHPDKLCDQVSDAVLDALLAQDRGSRVAVESAAKGGAFWVFGEIASKGDVDPRAIVERVVKSNGYTAESFGVDPEMIATAVSISRQSPDIAQGVNVKDALGQGAGDQGLMVGYATDETSEMMPLPIILARKIIESATAYRETGAIRWMRPDAKAQVSVVYNGSTPSAITSIILSSQHDPDIKIDEVRAQLFQVARSVLPDYLIDEETKFYINPTGRFVLGGPVADAGLTGRKIIVDTYGGASRHGGGAFSGKDPSKVDRTGAYAARWIAKSVVAQGIAHRAEVEIAYSIGIAEPVAVSVDTFGESNDDLLSRRIVDAIDLRPAAIIERLGLASVKYEPCARGGHFGRRDLDLPWERTVYL
jgi:S-adenosylmethionine synthetase